MTPTFCIQPDQNGLPREALAIINSKSEFIIRRDAEPGCIPIGSVEYCERVFGPQPTLKQFYPEFLKPYLSRKIGVMSASRAYSTAFYKDAMAWKSDFESRVYQHDEPFLIPVDLLYQSEIVEFVNEWRFYVAKGVVYDIAWYQGRDEDQEFSYRVAMSLKWPSQFSGAIDFGELPDGRIELVEAHPPSACGWYGEGSSVYALWMEHAWECRDFWLKGVAR